MAVSLIIRIMKIYTPLIFVSASCIHVSSPAVDKINVVFSKLCVFSVHRSPAMPVKVPKHVVVHPIVLLSVVDHFNRLSRIGNQRRVVGVLLGSWRAGVVDVATSFAGT